MDEADTHQQSTKHTYLRYEPEIRRLCMFMGALVGLAVDRGVVPYMYFAVIGLLISQKICYEIKLVTFALLAVAATAIAWITFVAGAK